MSGIKIATSMARVHVSRSGVTNSMEPSLC